MKLIKKDTAFILEPESPAEQKHLETLASGPGNSFYRDGVFDLDQLLFRLIDKKGHVYRLYLSGKIEGFPPRTFIANFAAGLFGLLYGLLRGTEKKQLATIIAKDKPE